MTRFKFSLESVLKLREAEEKQAKAEVAAAQHRLDALERHKAELEDKLICAQTDFIKTAKKGLTPDDFRLHYDYFDSLRKMIKAVQIDIVKARELLQIKQARLQEIYKARRTLEKLRETQYKEHIKQESAKEAKELEDILLPKMTGSADIA